RPCGAGRPPDPPRSGRTAPLPRGRRRHPQPPDRSWPPPSAPPPRTRRPEPDSVQPVLFGGAPALQDLLQEFFHYIAKIWLAANDAPQDADGLAAFRFGEVIAAYRGHRMAGRPVPLDLGLDVQQSYLLAQLLARRPLTCLLNTAMAGMPSARM